MATWTNIPDSSIETDKPIRAVDGRALRDNVTALAEGASGAPRIQTAAIQDYPWGAEDFQTGTTERDWILARIATLSISVLGAHGLFETVEDIDAGAQNTFLPGNTIAGSRLRYSAASGLNSGSSIPGGTWRCLGYAEASSATQSDRVTLFLRIA